MTSRLVLVLASLFASATAYAQAPGEWTPPPYAQPPGAAPAPLAPAPITPAPRPQRWSVGVAFGQTDLAPDGSDVPTTFEGGTLAVRYRGWRHLELELSLGGGRETREDGSEGSLAMGGGTLAARYRFNPERAWNWWLLAGFGQTTVAAHDASDAELEAARRPHVALGAGLERRWAHFALQFELRGLVVGQTESEMQLADQGVMVSEGLSGGSFALGASWYF